MFIFPLISCILPPAGLEEWSIRRFAHEAPDSHPSDGMPSGDPPVPSLSHSHVHCDSAGQRHIRQSPRSRRPAVKWRRNADSAPLRLQAGRSLGWSRRAACSAVVAPAEPVASTPAHPVTGVRVSVGVACDDLDAQPAGGFVLWRRVESDDVVAVGFIHELPDLDFGTVGDREVQGAAEGPSRTCHLPQICHRS